MEGQENDETQLARVWDLELEIPYFLSKGQVPGAHCNIYMIYITLHAQGISKNVLLNCFTEKQKFKKAKTSYSSTLIYLDLLYLNIIFIFITL